MTVVEYKYYLKLTIYISLVFQLLTGAFNLGLVSLEYYDIAFDDNIEILVQLIWLGLIVQVVEGTFYIWLVNSIDSVANITAYRYYDWFFSTPTMLITFVVYLLYLKERKEETDENKIINFMKGDKKIQQLRKTVKKSNNTLWDYMKQNQVELTIILLLNIVMLIFGYLGEINIISNTTAVGIGFIPFVAYFYIIYDKYAKHTTYGNTLFWIFAAIWSLYGVAALTSYYVKNISYNILDIFSKNFFEIFIGIKLLSALYY